MDAREIGIQTQGVRGLEVHAHSGHDGSDAPTGAMRDDSTVYIDPRSESIRAARDFARAVLEPLGTDRVESAVLCTSELVTNAIRYGAPPIFLTVRNDLGRVTIAVSDGSSDQLISRDPGASDARGRGLRIVAAVADEWGVDALPTGKRVWCRLDALTRPPRNSHGESA